MVVKLRASKSLASLSECLMHRPRTLLRSQSEMKQAIWRTLVSKHTIEISNGQPSYEATLKQEKIDRTNEDKNNQDLILDILEASATKRDARAYLNRFGPQKPQKKPNEIPPTILKTGGVNMGDFYASIRAPIGRNPALSRSMKGPSSVADGGTVHVALVKIRAPQSLDDGTLRSVLHTLDQLSRLGMQSVVIVDCDEVEILGNSIRGKELAARQVDRIVDVIDGLKGQSARRLDNIISISSSRAGDQGGGYLRVSHRELLLSPLRKGMIPIIASVGFNPDTATNEAVAVNEVILALTREFAGLTMTSALEDGAYEAADKIKSRQREISLDRIILLDPAGGMPHQHHQRAHRFINLEQEYCDLRKILIEDTDAEASHHASNLMLMKSTLGLLPPSSSGFITTPSAVALSETSLCLDTQRPGVGTRRQRNPLIHNLITDKPAVSFSLPQHRLETTSISSMGNVSTLLKKGMSLTIVPKLPKGGWKCPTPHQGHTQMSTRLGLRDPNLDLPRLTYLINDSFRRQLDVKAYDERTGDTLAGVIIAGNYQGAAIFTWEQPPDEYNLGAPSHPWVPYLDKFAVLRSAQGTATADILWNAMTNAFPQGFCWRSRTVNPVNKWYFERSKGCWELPETPWTMFWSKSGVFDEPDQKHWRGFLGVCKSVKPSWMDSKAID